MTDSKKQPDVVSLESEKLWRKVRDSKSLGFLADYLKDRKESIVDYQEGNQKSAQRTDIN